MSSNQLKSTGTIVVTGGVGREEWKDMIGFEGLYQISNHGRVKSLAREVTRGKSKSYLQEKIISLKFDHHYFFVTPSKNGKRKNVKVHRLVAIHFLEPVPGKTHVNHKDCNKKNNHISNLEWCTNQENLKHAARNGKVPNRYSNELRADVLNRLEKGEPKIRIARSLGIDAKTVRNILKNGI